MEKTKNILALKRILTALNCELSDPSVLDLLDDKTWFMGLYYGCLENDELTCAVPIYREDTSDLERYAAEVREVFSQFGETKKVALYRLTDGRTLAIQFPKEYTLRRFKYERTPSSLRGELLFKRPYLIKVFLEEGPSKENTKFCIGALIESKKKFLVRPLVVFKPSTFPQKRLIDLVGIISIHGPLVSGVVSWKENTMLREFRLIKTTSEFGYLIREKINLPLFEDSVFSNRIKFFSKTMTPKVFADGRMISANFPTGSFIDPDWFGREFGFFISTPEGRTLKFNPYTQKAQVGISQ